VQIIDTRTKFGVRHRLFSVYEVLIVYYTAVPYLKSIYLPFRRTYQLLIFRLIAATDVLVEILPPSLSFFLLNLPAANAVFATRDK
jgi:hypothetical protein